MAARNLLHGGTHYKDLFDTNLPGFVWAMTVLRWLFGSSVIAVRVVDLVVVLGVVLFIDRLAKWGGATLATRWWAFAGAALFYPFTVEMSHAQRDTWMALPGLAAVAIRVRRGVGETVPSLSGAPRPPNADHPFRRSFCEGLLWGAGVWMKPHIALIALAVWLLTARRLAGEHKQPWRAAGLDLLGNLLGGIAIAIPGVVWLVASGAWSDFLDVFLTWNPWYMKLARQEFDWRVDQELHWFPPWSFGLIVTVPLALFSVIDAALWSSRAAATEPPRPGPLGRWLPRHLWDKQAGADARFVRGVLSGVYLVWTAQAFFIQRGFQYAHVPETLLMIGVWTSHRWAWVPLMLAWLTVTSGLWIVAEHNPNLKHELDSLPVKTRQRYLPQHLITDTSRLRLWPECWRFNMSDMERYRLWDKLRLHPPHEASISWEEIGEVADFLRSQDVKDGEVIAWFDSPHAVYLLLDIKPGIRFMHVYTAISIAVNGDDSGVIGREKVWDELQKATGAKYVINDLEWVTLPAGDDPQKRAAMLGPPRNPPHDLLPVFTPYPKEFPFNQPTVFRSRNGTGRYIVHRIVTLGNSP